MTVVVCPLSFNCRSATERTAVWLLRVSGRGDNCKNFSTLAALAAASGTLKSKRVSFEDAVSTRWAVRHFYAQIVVGDNVA